MLFKVLTSNLMNTGADLDWVSMYPGEKEVLFPPLTFLEPTSIEGQAVGTAPDDCTIVTVVPIF